MSGRVFKSDGFDSANVVEVPRCLGVGRVLRERDLRDEVASLFHHVLLEVGAQDDVDHCCLPCGVKMQAAGFVSFENLGSDAIKFTCLFICK